MTEKQRRWFYRTRDPDFLWKLGLCIVLAGFALAWVAEGLAHVTGYRKSEDNAAQTFEGILQGSTSLGDHFAVWDALHDLARKDYETFLQELGNMHATVGDFMPDFFTDGPSQPENQIKPPDLSGAYAEGRQELEKWDLASDQKDLALLLWDALGEVDADDEPSAGDGPKGTELKTRGEVPRAPRFTNWALALYAAQKQNKSLMYAALEREGRGYPEAKRARELLINVALRDDPETAERLLQDALFADQNTPRIRLMAAVNKKDWGAVFWKIPAANFQEFDPANAVLAVIAGVVWFVILLRTVRTPRLFHPRTGLGLLAVLLGVLSVWPTLWLVYWQTYAWGLTEDPTDLLQNLKYFIAGVGLREELAKLLMFLPLGIYLAREGDGPEILVLAGCVGLGFAIEENIGYFAGEISAVSVGRFLTANVMHITMTGLAGLALCRALRNPIALGDFLGTFTLVVIAHGLYDALGGTAGLEEYGFLSMTIMIGLTYLYFHQIHGLLPGEGRHIYSQSAVFIGGLALIFSCTLILLAFRYSALSASVSMYFGALSNALLIIVYLRQFKEVRA